MPQPEILFRCAVYERKRKSAGKRPPDKNDAKKEICFVCALERNGKKYDKRNSKNNQVTICGKVVSGFRFSYEAYGKKYYMVDVDIRRLSGNVDCIPVMISEELADTSKNLIGQCVYVAGEFRSYNQYDGNKRRLKLNVFAKKMVADGLEWDSLEGNAIFLDGYVCRQPVYRITPRGYAIADLLVAVNRPYGRSDYIPCICWGYHAQLAAGFGVSSHIKIWGRIQSREYLKKLNETETEKRVAYEVSINRLEYVDDKKAAS